ncbi:hypothetical protein ACFVZW_25740 [Streptomyces sp. NPDC059567]|uniref:hypothetical protein n=1 Tax=Streptomyces sp. NPDC059567 TaxID=3346867 RepID=UPI0036A289EF
MSRPHAYGLTAAERRGDRESKTAGKLAPAGAAKAIDLIVEWANQAQAVPLREIVSVAPFRKSSLRITTRDGKHRDFTIAATIWSPIWSRSNAPHRDEMLAAIRQTVPSA